MELEANECYDCKIKGNYLSVDAYRDRLIIRGTDIVNEDFYIEIYTADNKFKVRKKKVIWEEED